MLLSQYTPIITYFSTDNLAQGPVFNPSSDNKSITCGCQCGHGSEQLRMRENKMAIVEPLEG